MVGDLRLVVGHACRVGAPNRVGLWVGFGAGFGFGFGFGGESGRAVGCVPVLPPVSAQQLVTAAESAAAPGMTLGVAVLDVDTGESSWAATAGGSSCPRR